MNTVPKDKRSWTNLMKGEKRKLKYTVHKSSMATDILEKIKHRWAASKFAL